MKTNRKHMKIYLFQAFKKIQILKNDTSFFPDKLIFILETVLLLMMI